MNKICMSFLLFASFVTPVSAQSPQWLSEWLKQQAFTRDALVALRSRPEANRALTVAEATEAKKMLWNARREVLREKRAAEMKARAITLGERQMPFWYKVFGEKPKTGRSLFISMHGGGGAPARVNDQQYQNQKRLYEPDEGVYLVPRAPTNTWNLWHQGHIDAFFDRLITNMIVFEDVNPDRVYIMGYSAGGDGVYQLAPRMADRWAAAAMMAGHPNEAKPDNLRNIGFTLHMGGDDAAYKRNEIAAVWEEKLSTLQEADNGGYRHKVVIHKGLGHWMQRKDSVAVPWMAEFTRNPHPPKVVWYQDDVTQSHFYWLAVPDTERRAGSRVVVTAKNNQIHIHEADVRQLRFWLSDQLVSLDQPVKVIHKAETLFERKPKRTVLNLAESLLRRDDPAAMAPAVIDIKLP